MPCNPVGQVCRKNPIDGMKKARRSCRPARKKLGRADKREFGSSRQQMQNQQSENQGNNAGDAEEGTHDYGHSCIVLDMDGGTGNSAYAYAQCFSTL